MKSSTACMYQTFVCFAVLASSYASNNDCTVITIDPEKPIDNKTNDGELIFFTGLAEAHGNGAKDPIFGQLVMALKMKRTVQMYQWTGDDGQTAAWEEELIDSSSFSKDRQNPTSIPFDLKTEEFYADNIAVGNIELPNELLGDISEYYSLDIWQVFDDISPNGIQDERIKEKAQGHRGSFYIGDNDYENPNVGDVLVSFSIVTLDSNKVSVLAMQNHGDSVAPWHGGNNGGESVFVLENGIHTLADMPGSFCVKEDATKAKYVPPEERNDNKEDNKAEYVPPEEKSIDDISPEERNDNKEDKAEYVPPEEKSDNYDLATNKEEELEPPSFVNGELRGTARSSASKSAVVTVLFLIVVFGALAKLFISKQNENQRSYFLPVRGDELELV